MLLALASSSSRAQESQFSFDRNGNLLTESPVAVAPPQILVQPQAQLVGPGELASFFVLVTDSRSLTYQWRFNNANISGATNETLLLRNVSAANEGLYSVVLVNPSGSVTSAPAALMIDSDEDGLADAWELPNFGNLNQNASSDFDGDNVSNLNEFRDGTSPTNSASSLFRLTVLADGGSVFVAPDQLTYTNGQPVMITVTENPGDRFQGWTGDALGTNNPLTIAMTNNQSVFAHFRAYGIAWTNSAGGNWHAPVNWSPNLVPNADDDVAITNSITITVNGDGHCHNFTFGGGGPNPTLNGAGALTIHGTWVWSAGVMSGNGRTIIAPEATLTISSPVNLSLNTRTLENAGTALWTGAGAIVLNNAVITNRPGALFQTQSAGDLSSGGGVNRFDNAGTFRKSAGGTTTVFSAIGFNNYGAVELVGGNLDLGGGGTHSGSFDVTVGRTLIFSGGMHTANADSRITGAGNLTVSGSVTATLAGLVNVSGTHTVGGLAVNLTGNYICTNNTLAIPLGVASFNGTGTVTPATLTLNGTLSGSNTVTVLNQMTWSGGGMSGSGRTIIPPGATLTINNLGRVNLNTRTLDNGGTVLWTGAGGIMLTGAVITNRAGALFQAQNAAALSFGGGAPRFDNAGTFRKSSSGTTAVFGSVRFNNYGAVEIRRGILQANGGYTSSSNALLNSALGGTTAGTGFGQLQVAGSVDLNGSLSVDLTNAFVPALNDSFAILTAGTRNGSFTRFFYPPDEVTMQLSNRPNSVLVRVIDAGTPSGPKLLQPELSDSDLKLIWSSIPNTAYRLEFKSDLNSTNWNALPGDVLSVSNTASKLDPLTPSNRFYRVRLLP